MRNLIAIASIIIALYVIFAFVAGDVESHPCGEYVNTYDDWQRKQLQSEELQYYRNRNSGVNYDGQF